jgi:hypothetical protein
MLESNRERMLFQNCQNGVQIAAHQQLTQTACMRRHNTNVFSQHRSQALRDGHSCQILLKDFQSPELF